jgi:hypothetical protein
MRIEPITVEAFTIYDAPALDPVLVMLQDFGGGSGRLLIECFGSAWSAYWGAMGDNGVRGFVCKCSADYLANRLWPSKQRRTKNEYAYLTRLVEAVQAALASQSISQVMYEFQPTHC